MARPDDGDDTSREVEEGQQKMPSNGCRSSTVVALIRMESML
jgi:hypothetical protein